VIRVVTAGVWTAEDRALMLAWATYQAELCPGCGHPKATAWHHHSSDSFDLVGDFVCWACTARQPKKSDGSREPVKFPVVEDTRDYAAFPLDGPPQPEYPD
jgi:hypothetical protein